METTILLDVKIKKDLLVIDGNNFLARTANLGLQLKFIQAFLDTHLFHICDVMLEVNEGLDISFIPNGDYYRIVVTETRDVISFTIDQL